jgi:hypothetical protein
MWNVFPRNKLTACFFLDIICTFLELFIINLDFKKRCMLQRSLLSVLSIDRPTSQYEPIVVSQGLHDLKVQFPTFSTCIAHSMDNPIRRR